MRNLILSIFLTVSAVANFYYSILHFSEYKIVILLNLFAGVFCTVVASISLHKWVNWEE